MSDFIFNPEKGFDPGEIGADLSQLPIVHKLNPLFEQFNKVNIPLTPGGGQIGGAKPTLHIGEPQYVGKSTASYKTPDGDIVYYEYKGEPPTPWFAHTEKHGQIYGDAPGQIPISEINFPPHPATQPPKPSLHVGELKPTIAGSLITNEGKTSDGGTVYYNYGVLGQPVSADIYDADGGYKAYYSAKDGTYEFPPAPKPIEKATESVKTSSSYIEGAGGVHYEKSSFDATKKELAFTAPLRPVPDYHNVYEAPLENGHTAWVFYRPGGKPEAIHEYLNKDGTDSVDFYNSDDTNFPVSPDVYSAPSKFPQVETAPSVHDKYSTQFATYKNFDDDKPEFELAGPAEENTYHPSVQAWPLENGNTLSVSYDSANKPNGAIEFSKTGGIVKEYKTDEVNLPELPAKSPKGWESVGESSEPTPTPSTPPRETPYPELKLLRQLTPDEVRSVKKYTGSFYSSVNGYLRRKNNLHTEDFARDQDIEDHIVRLDRAIEQHPLENETVVYRGISHELFGKLNARLEPGESFTHHGYMSTSTRENFAESWKNGTRLVITAPKGTKALPVETLSNNQGENEIIFPQETRLKLIRKEPKVMYFEVISNGR